MNLRVWKVSLCRLFLGMPTSFDSKLKERGQDHLPDPRGNHGAYSDPNLITVERKRLFFCINFR